MMATDRKDKRIEVYEHPLLTLVEENDRFIAASFPEERAYYGGGLIGPGLSVFFFDESDTMTGDLTIFDWNRDLTVDNNIRALTGSRSSHLS